MTIWVGKEQEGIETGSLTYFVKCKRITKHKSKIISKIIPDNSRVYLGAGRVDLRYVYNIVDFIALCKEKNYKLVLESSVVNLVVFTLLPYLDKFIYTVRKNLHLNYKKLAFKIDTGKDYALFESCGLSTRSLDDLKNDMYLDIDKIIYNK